MTLDEMKAWDGINPYLFKQAKKEYLASKSKVAKPKIEKKKEEAPIKVETNGEEEETKKGILEKIKDTIEDIADDGKLNQSNKKKKGSRWN